MAADYIVKLSGQDNLSDTIKNVKNSLADVGKETGKLDKIKERFDKIQNSSAPLKRQLRDLKALMSQMNMDGLSNTHDFEEMAMYAGEVKDAMADANDAISRFADDNMKLSAMAEGFSLIAGAASTATGIMGMFGVENDKVQAAILKVQSVMAALNGVQAIANALNKDSVLMHRIKQVRLAASTAAQSTIRKGTAAWIDLHHNNDIRFEGITKISLKSDMHSDTDTNITISDVYNQIKIKCNLEDKEDVITSPLDDDTLTSPWSAKQLYMDEYIVSNTKGSGRQAFADMILGKGTEHADAKTITWYLQMMQSNAWKLNTFHGKTLEEALPNSYLSVADRYIWQHEAPLYVKQNRLSPCIFRMGSAEGITKKDNSPTAKLDTNTYLYISVNGNEKDTEADAVPTPQELENNADMIEYVGNASGGIFSPSDDDTTNYLVFSGSMLLQPIVKESGIYSALKKTLESKIENMYQIHTVDGEDGKKRLYTRKFHAMETPKNNTGYYYLQDKVSLQPWTKDKGTRLYKYQYTAKKDGTDRYSKLPVLECELIIGNKRLIEKDIDMYGNSTFEWVKLGEEPSTVDSDGNTGKITTFTLGINPKIDDYIIGQEYSMQNTVKYDMNVDAEGTAIPIKKSDALSGGIIFRILGPCNLVWNDVVRKHKTWFRRAKYKNNDRAILAHLENIIIKNFECKIYSDNGKLDSKKEQSDLIYISAENNKYINAKDDIEFKLITQPTSKECMEKGLKNTINMNAVINTTTSMPLSTLYNTITKEHSKAEEHYISQYYEEYSVPRICMETTLKSNVVEWRYLYSSCPLKKEFYPIKIVENVKAATSTITMKER